MENKIVGCGVLDAPQKHYFKKVLSLLLSFVMLLSIIAGLDLLAYAEIYEFSGYCGDNVSFNLNINTGNLNISGKGKMKNFSSSSAPWDSNRSYIKTITMEDGVTSIGTYAFYLCKNLTTIKVSKTIENIGDNAFCYCESLTNILIPDSVKSIGEWSFANCTDLKSFATGNSLKNIEKYSFYNCVNLESIKIGNKVESINSSAFENCSYLTSVKLPLNVKAIESFAFDNCSSLDSIIFENPNCEFSMFGRILPKNTTVYGYKNSTAEAYAKENGNKFVAIDAECSHAWNSGKVTKAATCTANGVKTYTCTKCKATKTEAIKATGHSYDAGKVTKAPTATTVGVKTYTCTKCKATKTETIKATGLKTPVLKAAVNANGTIKLSWGKVAEAEKYELYIKQADGSYKLMKTTTGTSFTTGTAAYGKQYTYKMRAVAGNTKSAYSAAVNATNTKKLQTPTMKVTVNANGTFTLSWNKVAGATSYQLYIKQADGSYKLMKTTNATSFTTAFATYGKQFTYKMRAVTSKNSSATSAYSAAVNAKNTKKLQTPAMKATVNANGTFKLSWNAVAGATSYQLYIKQADGSYKLMKTTNATSFTTAFATYGKQFAYKMRAVTSKNSSATSAYSSAVNAINNKKLQTPTLKVAVNSNGTFKLSWNAVTGATSYQLYIKQADGSYKLMKTTNATSFTTAFATYGKQFTYKMRAVTSKNSSAISAYSSAVNAKNTKKLQTPTLKVAVNKNGSFKLSWGKVTGATSYQLYIKQANGSYKLMKTTSSTSFTTAVAAKGKTYSYKVRAVTGKNKNATSNYSNVVSAKRK